MAHSLLPVYDKVSTWDCEFRFTPEEIQKWRHEDFYLFLYGQKTIQGSFNSRYSKDWQDSRYYRVGKAKAFKESKPKVKRLQEPRKLKIKTIQPRAVTTNKKYKIFYDGILYTILAPKTSRKRFVPEVGMNITIDAKDQYYFYYIRQSKYIFVFDNSILNRPLDLTSILYGRGEWPKNLQHITLCFDAQRIVDEAIREYHFLNFIIRNKRLSYAVYTDWLEFRLLAETSPGSIY